MNCSFAKAKLLFPRFLNTGNMQNSIDVFTAAFGKLSCGE